MCQTANPIVSGVTIPDTQLTKDIREFVRDTSTELLFHYSSRVYYFAALRGQQLGLSYDAELLYAGAMFHDLGLIPEHSSKTERFEVDGANAAREVLLDLKRPVTVPEAYADD